MLRVLGREKVVYLLTRREPHTCWTPSRFIGSTIFRHAFLAGVKPATRSLTPPPSWPLGRVAIPRALGLRLHRRLRVTTRSRQEQISRPPPQTLPSCPGRSARTRRLWVAFCKRAGARARPP